jgi:hypothetical protein
LIYKPTSNSGLASATPAFDGDLHLEIRND